MLIKQKGLRNRFLTETIVVTVSMLTIFSLSTTGFAVMAGDGQHLVQQRIENSQYSFGAGISLVLNNAEGKEFVYVDEETAQDVGQPTIVGDKISDLRWHTKNAWLVGGTVSAMYRKVFTLNLGYWTKIAAAEGRHTDDDWMYWLSDGQQIQTNYSEGDSELDTGNTFDVNGKLAIFPSSESSLRMYGLVGYRKMHWGWEEHDSYGIYFHSSDQTQVFHDDKTIGITGEGEAWQSKGTGITYDQKISIPYIGINLGYGMGPVSFEAYALYSGWTEIEVEDHHINRSMISEGTLDDGTYWAGGANVIWKLSDKITTAGTVEFENIETVKGQSTQKIYVDDDGNSLSTPQTSEVEEGAAYNAISFMLNITYSF